MSDKQANEHMDAPDETESELVRWLIQVRRYENDAHTVKRVLDALREWQA